MYFCSSNFCVNFLSERLCVDGELNILNHLVNSLSPKISYGIVGGLGLGLMYVPAVTAVGYWFEKKRSLVTGEICQINVDVSFATGALLLFFVLYRNLNMWFWIWDNCLCPSGDPPAGMVKLAVDQQDHRWILPLGIFFS